MATRQEDYGHQKNICKEIIKMGGGTDMKQNIIHIASEVIQNSSFSGTLRTKQKF